MDFLQQHATADLAHAGNGLEPIEGVGIGLLGRRDTRQRQSPQQIILVPNQGQVDFDALLDGGLRKPLGDAVTVGFGGDLLANLGQMVLTVSLLHMGPGAPPASVREAAAVGAGRGWTASPQERHTPVGACPPAGAPRFSGHRLGRFWPCHRGWPSSIRPARGQKACLHGHRDRPASPRERYMRHRRRCLPDRAQWP